MRTLVILTILFTIACHAKREPDVRIPEWNSPPPIEFDLPEDEDLDDLPEAGEDTATGDEFFEDE